MLAREGFYTIRAFKHSILNFLFCVATPTSAWGVCALAFFAESSFFVVAHVIKLHRSVTITLSEQVRKWTRDMPIA